MILVNDNAESRRMVEQCYKRHKTTVNPIIDWTNSDVWTFIRAEGIPYCSLYDCGHRRLGCLMCPMASTSTRERDALAYPKYKAAYLRAFDKMLKRRIERGRPWTHGSTAQDVYNMWMEYDILPGQMDLFEEDNNAD